MSEVGEAIEGIIALVAGGFVLVLIGSALESSPNTFDIGAVGVLMIFLGIVVALAVVAAILGQLLTAIGGGR